MTTTSETVDAVARVYAQSLLELADAAGGDEKIVETGGELGATRRSRSSFDHPSSIPRSGRRPCVGSSKAGCPIWCSGSCSS
jgi:hypothetical protein